MSFAVSVLLGIGGLFAIAAALRAVARATLPEAARSIANDIPLTAAFGILVIVIYAAVAIAAPVLAPFAEREIVGNQFEAWSSEHLLGTDRIGRDMLSRLIYGARNTVGIAFATTALAFVVGSFLGLWAALTGGWLDQILSRFVDALMSIPALIFSLLLLTIFGTSVLTLILVIAAVDSTRVFRLARAVAQGVVVMDYIEAAKLRGEGSWFLIRREILPNALAPLVAEFGLRFCFVFLTIAALSFLGVGIQPPTADWGSMVRETAGLIQFAEYDFTAAMTPMLPAAAIALLTVAVNFVVDWFLHKSSGLKD